MSNVLTTSSFTAATDAMTAWAAPRLRKPAQISLCGADFALAGGCIS